MANKKYKDKFEKDYQFYFNNRLKFKFAGCVIASPPYDKNGVDAKYAFWAYDSQGKLLPCYEPELFVEIMSCKKSINLHFKMWAEGWRDCLIPVSELMESFSGEIPNWVEISLQNQVDKMNKERDG